MQLQYLWAWIDSVVFKKWLEKRVVKFYWYNPKLDRVTRDDLSLINLRKLKFYHQLHNRFAWIIFDKHIDWDWIDIAQLGIKIKVITFEILHLDTNRIWRATKLDHKFLAPRFIGKDLIVSEVDYVEWETLEELWLSTIWNEKAREIWRIVSQNLASIYNWTQISSSINRQLMIWQPISLTNMKVRFYGWGLHIVITDTLNCIWSLIPYLN